ncbi:MULTISPECIES: hypothetical protein [Thalassobaculum]|uniref:Uncharacterized protein n=1 Tax=Thalassobaculum litoreum DSM 18839 TaxID=1123362 RepID=A0A8G2BMD3_9PROT|nr:MULTISPECIES: hypothetical protein [Thalassobaculum]SDG53573.1 hypothetical protein SAMN05660686_04747 [Thalassobaculum litoreum DSM 18839]
MSAVQANHRNAGFGWIAVIMIVLILVVAIGAFFVTSSNSSFSRIHEYLARLNGNSIYSTAGSINSGISFINAQGWGVEDIDFVDTASANTERVSLFDPVSGAISEPTMSTGLFITRPTGIDSDDWGKWALIGNTGTGAGTFTVPDVATTAPEWAIVLTGIKDKYCKSINSDLWGVDEDDDIPVASAVASTTIYTPMQQTTRVQAVTVNLTSASPSGAFDGQSKGCAQTSDGVNFFYLVVNAR